MKKTKIMVAGIFSVLLMLSLVPLVLAEEADLEDLPEPRVLPDSGLYGLKRAAESVRTAFTLGDESKANRGLSIAEMRLAEAKAMAEKEKPEFVDELMNDYEENLERANEIARVTNREEVRERVSERVANATSKHISVLDEVSERVPEHARAKIFAAQEKSMRGNEEALNVLARENPKKAAEMAMNVAAGRAERARQMSEREDFEGAEEAAKAYERYSEFGQGISTIAQEFGKDYSNVDDLIATATEIHKTVLEQARERAPEQAMESFDSAIAQAERSRGEATQRLEDALEQVPEDAGDMIEEGLPDAEDTASELIEDAEELLQDADSLIEGAKGAVGAGKS